MQFTIDRQYWRCGGDSERPNDQAVFRRHGKNSTCLRNPHDELMCCIGQCMAQCGVNAKALNRQGEPRYVHPSVAPIGREIFWEEKPNLDGMHDNSSFVERAMAINDKTKTLPQREKELTALFAEHGHELVFEGEYQKELLF